MNAIYAMGLIKTKVTGCIIRFVLYIYIYISFLFYVTVLIISGDTSHLGISAIWRMYVITRHTMPTHKQTQKYMRSGARQQLKPCLRDLSIRQIRSTLPVQLVGHSQIHSKLRENNTKQLANRMPNMLTRIGDVQV